MNQAPTTIATVSLLLAALAFGAVLLTDYGDDPFAEILISDARSYDLWGRRIAAEGLGDEPVFHQSPLFPIILSWTYGEDSPPGVPRLFDWIQIILCAVAIALLVPIGKLYLGSLRAGIVAGAAALLHAPILFHALKLLPVSLALASQAAALALLGLYLHRPRAYLALAAGLAAGIAAAARAEFLLFVPVAVLAAALAPGEQERRARVLAALLVLAGFCVAVAPVTAHNLAKGDFVVVASAGGENLFIGNQRGAEGSFKAIHPGAGDLISSKRAARQIAEKDAGRKLKPSEISSYWRGRAMREVAADPGGWLRLEWRKLLRILHLGDPSDMYSMPLERSLYLPTLHALAVPYGLVLAAGALGIFLAVRSRRRGSWPLLAYVAMHLAVLLGFFVSTRLRMPLAFALLPFAGHALCELFDGLRSRKGRAWALACLAAVALCTVASLASTRPTPRERTRLAAILSSRGDLEPALDVLAPVTVGGNADPLALDQAGYVLQKMQRWQEAESSYRRALEAGMPAGREVSTLTRLGVVLERQGRLEEAGARHDEAVSLPGANAGTWYERGMFRLRAGDREGAREDLMEALRLDPGYPAPREALRSLW